MMTATKKVTKDETKDEKLTFRTYPGVTAIAEKLAKRRKWSVSLLCDEFFRDMLIREMRKESGFEKEIELLKSFQ